jgi:hypothetical protein
MANLKGLGMRSEERLLVLPVGYAEVLASLRDRKARIKAGLASIVS